MSSMFNMANGLLADFGENTQSFPPFRPDWEDDRLFFIVHEPFIRKISQANLTCGRINPGDALVIESEMPAEGVIFSNRFETDFLAFNAGAVAIISLANKKQPGTSLKHEKIITFQYSSSRHHLLYIPGPKPHSIGCRILHLAVI